MSSDPQGPRFRPNFWNDDRTITEPTVTYKQESQKEANFRRSEDRKDNAMRRGIVLYVLVLLSIVLAYTGYLIYDVTVPADTKRWCFGLWGFILGGLLGYLSPRPS
jgi:hypothetical protein